MHETSAYDELYVYTMGRPRFILQHVVDAHAAQAATTGENSIGLVFGLVGLYLHLEKRFDGTQVQHAHRKLGQQKRVWPTIMLPERRAIVTPETVMTAAAGPLRDVAIDHWCASVWAEYQGSREIIVALLREYRF